ncbi:hypothetical protein [Saccharopolyspora spinosa]|uniref:Fucose-specific lectin n=1 Tax=Saccharopolyspora spinosa TaxID=60894 RepID=A0A2N3XR57_SACSN|nr:hypothetical protein [Saccharopolyspora spinosa]PKW13080.1 hypothetical protein A8926_0581 [Saccharopolyspora spinosa]
MTTTTPVVNNRATSQRGIAALSRRPDHMEIWRVTPNGAVKGAYHYDGGGLWKTYDIAPDANSANAETGIAALSRRPDHMEIWWVTPDGAVKGAYWYEEPKAPWKLYEIAPVGSASLKGHIAALSRRPDTMEIWWVAPDGAVKGACWYQEPKDHDWTTYNHILGTANVETGITALSRIPTSMEIWCVANGAVKGSYYDDGNPWKTYDV